jgi:hypothetical protein
MLKTIKIAMASATLAAAVAAGAPGAIASPSAVQEATLADTAVKTRIGVRRFKYFPRCHRYVGIRSVGFSKIRLGFRGYRYIRFHRYKPQRVRTYRSLPPIRVCVGGWYTFTAWKGARKYRIVTHAYTGRIVYKRVIGGFLGASARH